MSTAVTAIAASSAASVAAAHDHDTRAAHGPAAPSPRRPVTRAGAARLAGVAYVVIYALAIFANFAVVEGLVDRSDPVATTEAIAGSLGTFRLGTLAFGVVFVLDVVIAWALHVVLRAEDPERSQLAAWARLTYTVFLGVGLVFFWRIISVLDDVAAGTSTRTDTEVANLVGDSIVAFDAAWLIGLAAFGVHLLVVGSIVLRARLVHPAMGWLLIAAGVAYPIDTVAHIALADYATYADAFLAMVAVPSMLGEGWLGLWLLTRAPRRLAEPSAA